MADAHLEAEAVASRRGESLADEWEEGEVEALLKEVIALSGPPPIQPGDVRTSDFVAATGLTRRAALDRMMKVAAENDDWETLIVADEGNRTVRVLRKARGADQLS